MALAAEQRGLRLGDRLAAGHQKRSGRVAVNDGGDGVADGVAAGRVAAPVGGQAFDGLVALAFGLDGVGHLEVGSRPQIVRTLLPDAVRLARSPVVRGQGHGQGGRQDCGEPQQDGPLPQVRQDRVVAARGTAPAIPLADPRRLLGGGKHIFAVVSDQWSVVS